MFAVRYTPRLADLMPADAPDATMGPANYADLPVSPGGTVSQ